MSARLKRLLGVRTVRLRVAARDLAGATRTATNAADVAARLDGVSADLAITAGAAGAYAVKATAATRAALAAAGARQSLRHAEAVAVQARLTADLHRRRAAADAVARAVEAKR